MTISEPDAGSGAPLIIAEAGVNHNGDLGRALAMVDAAADAGADFVKFQTFRADELATTAAPKAAYQRAADGEGSQQAMLRRLELSQEAHHRLLERCASHGIGFLSTPFDLPSLAFLTRDLGLETLKIASGEITNGPLLLAAAREGRRIILSSGMSDLEEVRAALGVLAFGFVAPADAPPTPQAFTATMASSAGQAALAERITVLHCVTQYPAPVEDTNLRAMAALAEAFNVPVGLSDHTLGITVAIAATALGARVIEKHFTLDRRLPGPDHQASLEPADLAALVVGIKAAHAALGSGIKCPVPSEVGNQPVARKSLVALQPIAAGAEFTVENLGIKRPGTGVSPMFYWSYLGRPAPRAYAKDEVIVP